jgi:protocatechuate 3,4-dioxygenase beta subunit
MTEALETRVIELREGSSLEMRAGEARGGAFTCDKGAMRSFRGMSHRHPPAPLFARRDVVLGSGVIGLASLPMLACAQQRPAPHGGGRLIVGDTCPVTPEQIEGPFYFDPRLVRQDIAEGRPGLPFRLRLQIVEAADCTPSARARIDIWHCDAAGAYSGYDSERTQGERWLRGTQLADGDGVAEFQTIYPGWYQGRAPHVHVKAWLANGRQLTSQLYFPDALSGSVYAEGVYAERRGRWLRNGDDGIFRSLDGAAPVARVERGPAGYDGAIVLSLA